MKIVAIAFAVITAAVALQGCMAVPVVLGANMIHKSGTATATIEGKGPVQEHFRAAVIKAGGVVTADSNDYSKAEFSTNAVKLELQRVQTGVYQLVGSSNTTVARSWELTDNIGDTTKEIAEYLGANGFTVSKHVRDRGI